MKIVDIIDVYEAVEHDVEGRVRRLGVFFATPEEGRRASNGYSEVEPIKREAVLFEDGTARVFETGPVTLFHSKEAADRHKALSKLTPDERRLLGL